MADKIKGLTVKIGADTSDYIKGLKKTDKEINKTARTARELQKGLKIEFDEKRFIQTQKQAQKALKLTEDKAEDIRKKLKELETAGRVDTEDYKTLQLELAKTETKAIKLEKQLEKINKIKLDKLAGGFKKVGDNLEKAGRGLAPFSAAAAGGLAGMVKLGKDAVKVGDDIQTMSDKFDQSTYSIQKWSYVAMQTDVDTDVLFKGANKVRAAFGKQTQGVIDYSTKALDKLGLKMEDFAGTEEAFDATIIALANIKDNTLQAAYANDIFGVRMAADMIPLLQAGGDAVKKYTEEFEQVGYLSDENVKAMAEYDNVMNRVNKEFDLAKVKLGIALIPVLEIFVKLLEEQIVPAIEKLAEWFDNLSPSMQETIVKVLGLIAVLSPMLILFGKISKAIGFLIPLMVKLKGISLATAAGFTAIAGAMGLSIDLIANWSKMSTVEKILKSLAVAALAAAAAITVFHASWSLGLAVGGITAGIVAGVAAINAAKKKILPDSKDIAGTGTGTTISGIDDSVYELPEVPKGGSIENVYNNDERVINVEVNVSNAEGLDADELAEKVSEQIALKLAAAR